MSKFKVGDAVTFINDNGVKFPERVIFAVDESGDSGTKYYFAPNDGFWFPAKESNLIADADDEVVGEFAGHKIRLTEGGMPYDGEKWHLVGTESTIFKYMDDAQKFAEDNPAPVRFQDVPIATDYIFQDAGNSHLWMKMADAENALAEKLKNFPFGTLVPVESDVLSDVFFLGIDEEKGKRVLYRADISSMDVHHYTIKNEASRFDFDLSWVDVGDEDIEQYTKSVIKATQEFNLIYRPMNGFEMEDIMRLGKTENIQIRPATDNADEFSFKG